MPADTIAYTEFLALTGCERRWVYRYVEHEDEGGARRGLHLGTLLHLGVEMWTQGDYRGRGAYLPERWEDDIEPGGKQGIEERARFLVEFDEEVVDDAIWLLKRWVEHYGSAPPSSWEILSTEEWMTAALGDKLVVGRTDAVVRIDGRLWLREVKSYGSKGRLDYVHIDPQLIFYKELVEATYGERLYGVMYDGIHTYRWKLSSPTQAALIAEREEHDNKFRQWLKKDQKTWAKGAVALHPGIEVHPAADSFERRLVEISPRMLEAGRTYISAAVAHRDRLAGDPTQALPSVGLACRACGYRERCWYELSGIEEEDEPGGATELHWEGE